MCLLKRRVGKKEIYGTEVYGKALGIIGLAGLGQRLQNALLVWHEVIAYDPFLSVDKANELGIESVEIKEIFRRFDYITVHAPLTEETRNIINKDSIGMMKQA